MKTFNNLLIFIILALILMLIVSITYKILYNLTVDPSNDITLAILLFYFAVFFFIPEHIDSKDY
jgi:hypothetical protein